MRARLTGAAGVALAALATAPGAWAQRAQVSVSAVAVTVGSALVVNGVEENGAGTWIGARMQMRLGPLSAEASALKGTVVGGAAAQGFDRDGGDVRVIAGLRVLSGLSIEGNYAIRAFESAAGYQRWTETGAGLRVSESLGTPALRGYLRATYLFGVVVSGQPSPDLALAVEGGLTITPARAPISAGVFYRLERFDFPGGGRLEHFDMLGVELGLSRGARR